MLSDFKFKIQLDSDSVSVYGEEKYIADKLPNDQMKRKLSSDDIAGMVLFLNMEYLVEFETREYGIKSVILSASSVNAFATVDYYVNKEDVMHRVNSGEFSSHTSETSTESIGQRLEDGMDESTKGEKPINCYMNDSTTRSSGKNSIEFTMEFGDKMASSSSVNDHGAHTDCDETSI